MSKVSILTEQENALLLKLFNGESCDFSKSGNVSIIKGWILAGLASLERKLDETKVEISLSEKLVEIGKSLQEVKNK